MRRNSSSRESRAVRSVLCSGACSALSSSARRSGVKLLDLARHSIHQLLIPISKRAPTGPTHARQSRRQLVLFEPQQEPQPNAHTRLQPQAHAEAANPTLSVPRCARRPDATAPVPCLRAPAPNAERFGAATESVLNQPQPRAQGHVPKPCIIRGNALHQIDDPTVLRDSTLHHCGPHLLQVPAIQPLLASVTTSIVPGGS